MVHRKEESGNKQLGKFEDGEIMQEGEGGAIKSAVKLRRWRLFVIQGASALEEGLWETNKWFSQIQPTW